MEPERNAEKLLWMAGEIHLARRRIREAVFMIKNSDDPDFFRSCYRYEIEVFKQYEPFYAYESKEFLQEIAHSDRTAIEKAIVFLDADPYCFRSGFIKKKLCSALKKASLTREDRARLRNIVMKSLLRQRPVSFADIASLGCHLYTPGFHERVKKLDLIPFTYLLRRRQRFLRLLDEEVKKRKNYKAPEVPTDTGEKEKFLSGGKKDSLLRKIFPVKFLTFFKKGVSMLWK